MITPFHRSPRGNTLTSARLINGLCSRGWNMDLLSLESDDWEQTLSRAINQKRYGLIHALNITHFSRVLAAFPDIADIPLLLTTTGTDINYDIQINPRAEVEKTLDAVQYIVIFNDYFRSIFAQYYPRQVAKLVTIPQGVSLNPKKGPGRTELGLNDDDFVFLLPSGLRPVKNLELAIDALEAVQTEFPYIRLLILGAVIDRAYGDFIQNRIKNLPWVLYPGEFPHDQMYSIMSAADVVLNTSLSEGQPQAALEAMSLGKPCLLTAVPGNLNIIEDGREGYYVRDQADIVSSARNLVIDHELRYRMGENARILVNQNYSVEKELNAYERLYKIMA
jgi:glycosyltransferase involved in cell wall biosynthesis